MCAGPRREKRRRGAGAEREREAAVAVRVGRRGRVVDQRPRGERDARAAEAVQRDLRRRGAPFAH